MSGWSPNHAGIGEMLRADFIQAHMQARAEIAAAAAVADSPVGDPAYDPHPGDYRDHWRVESGVREDGSRRAYGRVVNDQKYAAAVEFGNGRTDSKTIDAHYVLTRAIDAARD